jgi:hypothetical protein
MLLDASKSTPLLSHPVEDLAVRVITHDSSSELQFIRFEIVVIRGLV